MSDTERIELKPIGYVQTEVKDKDIQDREHVSKIIIYDRYKDALDGIEGFSHLLIIFWMHKISGVKRNILKVHPRGRADFPLKGVFATRTSHRPNPLGLSLGEILNIKDNVIVVRGLDAFNGTPILDLKPYDYWDIAEEISVPKWWIKLEKHRSK